ncbi:MAG: ATP-dependent Clp protease ATP-binding subunit ClpX, partial [Candidatus Thiodiazotropha sp.]
HVDLSDASNAYDQLKIFEEVRPDDLRHFGLIPEFVGRFPVITALHDLDEQALVSILTQPRNALTRQYQRLFDFEGVNLEFTETALAAIAREAMSRGTGARGLRAVMEGMLRKVMFDMPSIEGAKQCLIDELQVSDHSKISIELGDMQQEQSAG